MDHLYGQVADSIQKLIQDGTLRPGEKIPSVRKLSQQRGVSVATVLQAYLLLESRGLISARPQSGYYVTEARAELAPEPKMSSPASSCAEIGVNQLILQTMQAERDPKIVPLASASSGLELLPTASLNRTLHQVSRKLGPLAHRYEMPPGFPELRRQIAKHALEWGCDLSPEEIVVTVGGMEALNLCLRVVARPGDIVAIESPTYYGILQVLESLGLRALEIPTHPRDGLSIEALETLFKKNKVAAVVAMPSIHNPLGSSMPEENKEKLVGILAKHDIPLIEDHVYGDLWFGPQAPRPARVHDKKGRVLLCSSFSKTLSPGLRLGWVAPGRYFRELDVLKFTHTIATPTLSQATVAEFLKSGQYERHLRELRQSFSSQVNRMTDAVIRSFPEKTCVTRPAGGFVLWAELPRGFDSLALQQEALKHGISFAPGPIFSAKKSFRNCLRLNCGLPWSPRLEKAIEKLGLLAQRQL